ncbi:MAG: hypothetical protein EAZ77_16125 [Nostocales cyanobacterium]|nr:MAG: hypothetical protein EAZ77_16125 [Nostocales cyanobacterium]
MSKSNFITPQKYLLLILSFSVTTCSVLPSLPSQAEKIPRPADAPLELNLLTKPTGAVITANTINLQGLTIPSLWWAKETSENKLLDNWIAYPASGKLSARVDLIVNQQIWSLLDYLERYIFVNRLGSMAKNFGYNIRVFNYQKEMLATYTCSLDINSDSCNIQMINQSKLGLRQTPEINGN